MHTYNSNNPSGLKLDKHRFRVKECPCGKSNKDGKFVPFEGYMDQGYCHACGNCFTPQKEQLKQPVRISIKPSQRRISYIPNQIFEASLKGYDTNKFIVFLRGLFGEEILNQLIDEYFIASSKHWEGATVYWQVDVDGNIRTGKIILYDSSTGKRVKGLYAHINWAHTLLKQPDYELEQCLFGEHLLKDNTKPIALVESEKTALIASVYLPNFLWLAVGSMSNLNTKMCKVLKGYSVTLFPDLNGYDNWCSKAAELSHLFTFTVSDLIQNLANDLEKKQGLDIADFLLRLDFKDFVKQKQNSQIIQSPKLGCFVELLNKK